MVKKNKILIQFVGPAGAVFVIIIFSLFLRGQFNKTVESFDQPIEAVHQKSFGKKGQLTFELFRHGTFEIDGASGFALQKSPSYRDSAYIRSTDPLPETYTVSVVVGGIDYGLENIAGLAPDPEYKEGPPNENGCYLLAITDQKPKSPHINDWWHYHRKVVIDVDNNVWGYGMPNPIFMVNFNSDNELRSFDGSENKWTGEWTQAVRYDKNAWYRIEIKKTKSHYVMSIKTEDGKVLKQASVKRDDVWHDYGAYPDYLVVGDPHENYYQGSMKIKEITIK